jgi:hypothetical protein
MRIRRTHVLFTLIAALILMLPIVLRVPNPYGNPVVQEVHETSHTVLFFIAQLVLLMIVRRRRPAWPLWLVILGTAALATAIGGLIELIQPYFKRSRSWDDLWRDVQGIIAACGVFYCFSAKQWSLRGVGLAIAGVTLVIAFAPLGKAWQRQWLLHQAFPVLADFEDPLLRKWIGRTEYARIRVTPAPDEWADNHGDVLEVFMPKDTRWSGFTLYHPVPHWRGYRNLHFDVFSTSNKSTRIAMNIYSVASGNKVLRYYAFTVEPGLNTFTADLHDGAPPVEGQYISRLLLYSIAPDRDHTLFFDDIRLSRE